MTSYAKSYNNIICLHKALLRHTICILIIILCWNPTNVIAQFNSSDSSDIKPLVPTKGNRNTPAVRKKNPKILPYWALPSLDSLGNRMQNANKYKVDSVPFQAKVIRYKKKHNRYLIWMYESNMIIRYQYTKKCKKRDLIKDCFWREINIPYSFIDSIRDLKYSAGYVIHYTNLMVRPAKFKLLVSYGEINTISKIIKDQAKARGVKLDSSFSKLYEGTWERRVKSTLALLNKLGLKKATEEDIEERNRLFSRKKKSIFSLNRSKKKKKTARRIGVDGTERVKDSTSGKRKKSKSKKKVTRKGKVSPKKKEAATSDNMEKKKKTSRRTNVGRTKSNSKKKVARKGKASPKKKEEATSDSIDKKKKVTRRVKKNKSTKKQKTNTKKGATSKKSDASSDQQSKKNKKRKATPKQKKKKPTDKKKSNKE